MSRRSAEQTIRIVTSNQQGIHENLEAELLKHQMHAFRKPIAMHTQRAFEGIEKQLTRYCASPIIFDSGCGTADSTLHLAKLNPDSWVIGIDRSATRLRKKQNQVLPENALTVQADLVDFWRLAKQANWHLQKHFILYPNPYPKSIHLKRRWHAHPVFPTLLSLGGQLELRTNWKIYADEFAYALQYLGHTAVKSQLYTPDTAWTLFEKKYHDDEQALYQCKLDLNKPF